MTSFTPVICPSCGAAIAPSLGMLIAARSRQPVTATPGIHAERLKRRRKRAFVRPGVSAGCELQIRAVLALGADNAEAVCTTGVSLGTVQRVRKAMFRDSFAHQLARAAG